jgi:hypothetical protein
VEAPVWGEDAGIGEPAGLDGADGDKLPGEEGTVPAELAWFGEVVTACREPIVDELSPVVRDGDEPNPLAEGTGCRSDPPPNSPRREIARARSAVVPESRPVAAGALDTARVPELPRLSTPCRGCSWAIGAWATGFCPAT